MKLEYLWGQLANVDQILYEASLRWGKGPIMFWDRLGQTPGFHGNRKRPWLIIGKTMSPPFLCFFFYQIFLELAGNEDRHKIWDEFEFRPDRTSPYRVRCPWASEKFPTDIMGKWCLQPSSFIFDRIFVKLSGNQDSHQISDEFEFRSDQISHFGVTCPCGRNKFSIDTLWNLQVQLTFQTLEFFVTLLLGTVRPIRLKRGTHVGSWQKYHVYWNQAAASYSSLYFFIFLSLQFSTLKCFVTLFSGTVRPRRLKLGTHVYSGHMYHVYWNQAAAAYSSLYFFIFLSLQFSTLKFLSHFSQELWGLEDWHLVHTWTVNRCIVYAGIGLLLLIHPFISSFFSFQFSNIKIFVTLFSGAVKPRRLKIGRHVDKGQMYHVYRNQAAAAYLSFYFLIFLSLQLSNIKNFRHIFLRNCEV